MHCLRRITPYFARTRYMVDRLDGVVQRPGHLCAWLREALGMAGVQQGRSLSCML